MKPRIRHLFVVPFLLAMAAGARAEPILPFFNGEIGFAGLNGTALPTGGTVDEFGVMSLADATGIDFDNSGSGSIFVTGVSEDFSAIPYFTAVTFSDIVFAAAATGEALWRIVHDDIVYEFIARTFTVDQSSSFLNVRARGSLLASGYEETEGSWAFSMDRAGSTVVGWSSTTSVPEPGTLLLFGLGLAGLAICRRHRLRPAAAAC